MTEAVDGPVLRAALALCTVLTAFDARAQSLPKPVIKKIVPKGAEVGDPSFAITIQGTGLVPQSIVRVSDGQSNSDRTTTSKPSGELAATLLDEDLDGIATLKITAYNPPPGGGISAVRGFSVYSKYGSPLSESPFDGVPLYSNGRHTTTGDGEHQCVAFIKRFYRNRLPEGRSVDKWKGNAHTYMSDKEGLEPPFENPDIEVPRPGDILVFKKSIGAPYGHVAIVKMATTSTVTIVEQNWSLTGVATLDVERINGKYRLKPRDNVEVAGWRRSVKSGPVNQKPTGSLDGVNASQQVFGWAKDPDNEAVPVQVHLYIDKNAGTTGATPIPVTAGDFREDVGNHAFNWSIPATLRDGQTHTVWAWGIDLTNPTGNNAQLPGSPKVFNIAPATNEPPKISSTAPTSGTVGLLYNYQVVANDPDGGSLTYSLDAAPAGMTISPSGLVRWQPAPSQVGAHTVTIRVTDPAGLFTTQSVNITVASQPQPSGHWVEKFFGHPPVGRYTAAMAYDSLRKQVILFGGNTVTESGSGRVNDTWVWNGTTWSQQFPGTSPPAYPSSIFMVYHASRDETILVTNYQNDFVWVWNGSNWTQRFHKSLPVLFGMGPMVYDRRSGLVFMYNGLRTLTWDGVAWTRLSPAQEPPNRSGHALAYDEEREEVVLFGGEDSNTIPLNDTWVWNGVDWTQRTPATSPPARAQHAMAFDGQRVVLFGGLSPVQVGTNPWTWDGSKWTEIVTQSTPQHTPTPLMVYDSGRREVVYYVGLLCCFASPNLTRSAVWSWVP